MDGSSTLQGKITHNSPWKRPNVRHQLTPGRNDISKRSSQEHVKMILVVECADANPHRYYRGLIISLIEHMQQLEGPVLQGKQHSS